MIFELQPRGIGITKEQVWAAWKRIKQGGKAAGVDNVTAEMIAQNPRKHLYPVWNRMSSGSYFPPAVREAAIPKSDGKERLLGIPTMCDRVAQEVVRAELEKELEPIFHPSSYGYRPNKSAHQALDACAENCWKRWYVVDVDIQGFFDNIDHEKMMEILRKYTKKKYVLLYCERWLKASVLKANGTLQATNGKGTPQGGVISPLLANLYLHEAFDSWMQEKHSVMVFERYADDIVIHTRSIEQSQFILDKLRIRLKQYGLQLHNRKTKIVYCYRKARFFKEAKNIAVSFDFLGYTFKPRICARADGQRFWGFRPAISRKNLMRLNAETNKLHRHIRRTITELAIMLRAKTLGWIRYYGHTRRSELSPLFEKLNERLAKWVRKKYRIRSWWKCFEWLRRVSKYYPTLFAHWKYGWVP
jgi:group II intron reverse transcriptase/maturase